MDDDDGDYLLLQPLVDTTNNIARCDEQSIWKALILKQQNPPLCAFLRGPYALDILLDHEAEPLSTMMVFLSDCQGFPLALSSQRFTKRRLQNIQIFRVETPEEIVQSLLSLSLVNVGFIGVAIPDDNTSFWKNDTTRNLIGT